MRFAKLHVENFKAIASADLELGPGLNVLYGPNDLGKSTLGQSLRAALLLPSDSSAADAYVPWQEPVEPLVTLTFLDDTRRWWRIAKRFTKNDATLAFSKDGHDFTVDAKERAVDEKLRKLLGWGIPLPGGKGGVRGMPESFIANALLAAQTDVAKILGASLEDDKDDSGRVTLTKALSALAQDPLVRHVLTVAQREQDAFFTATGKRKATKDSPLKKASTEVKALTDQLLEVQKGLHESKALEDEVRRLHDAWLRAQHDAELAVEAHAKALSSQQRANEKRHALKQLSIEQDALARVDALHASIRTADTQLVALDEAVTEREAAVNSAQESLKRAAESLRVAEEAHRKASSADGEAERAVARAQLKQEQATRQAKQVELRSSLEKAQAAQRATEERQRLTELAKQLEAKLAPAKERLSAAQGELALITAIIQYGHWRQASDAVKQAEPWRAQAKAHRAEAKQRSEQAASARTEAAKLRAEAEGLALPSEQERAAFERLRRELDLAEASLGGGVTVTVKPRSQLLLRSIADQGAPEERKLTHEHAIEADRRVQLSIGDLVDIEVVAGAAEKRKDAEHLKKRFKTEVMPALERCGVRSLVELQELVTRQSTLLERARSLESTVTQHERDAQALEQRAADLDERIASTPTAAQLEEKRKLVGPLDFKLLEQSFAGLGAQWESQTRSVQQAQTAAVADAQGALTKLENELQLTQARLADAKAKPGPVGDVRALEQQLAALETQLQADAEKLRQLELEGSSAVKAAEAALAQAKQQLARAEDAVAVATKARDDARRLAGDRRGERNALASQLTQADEPTVRARVEAAQRVVDSFADVELLTAEALQGLQRAAEHARSAAEAAGLKHADADGQLKKVGGPQAREQVRQLEEALQAAKAREHLLEVDAAAWKLLAEAVREAEKEDSSSLGAALANPVSEKFSELTKNRYGPVRFDANLTAHSLSLRERGEGRGEGQPEVLDALSVGTKDQLAMLVRLAIALQLQSAIVLDDHLVHTDLGRLEWFRDALRTTAEKTQVLVLTCRPLDYVKETELPTKTAWKDVDERTRVVDLSKVIRRR